MGTLRTIIIIVLGIIFCAAVIKMSIALGRRHDDAVQKLARLQRENKPADPHLLEILKADSLYMRYGGR